MLSAENLAEIRADGERIWSLLAAIGIGPVPQYPAWVMVDLAAHLGSIHARTTLICRELPVDRPSAPRPPRTPMSSTGASTTSRTCSPLSGRPIRTLGSGGSGRSRRWGSGSGGW